ncbi:UNVERIFIED_CONTAM: root hair defective 3 gtp-binding protein (rhd3) protein [Hammondia hammondi]|eukprot:XP_008883443.1 root hair defective 3 gtp-binding protein (rhd3) protein [Hammondia hammondi]
MALLAHDASPHTKKGETIADGQLIQIIDYDGDIVADIDAWMKKQKLADVGFNYNVITILGSQSSGKSSLMNAVFNCKFQVMDHVHGHSQTTKGIWLGRDNLGESGTVPCLVVDVEGIDSRERGEDRQTFEYRSALFALALTDCLCVNVWYHSLGNFTASGYGLLKTVMEVNLDLFAQERNTPRTLLLFAVRDWAEVMTPLEIVRDKIAREYVERIWREIKKPAAFENSSPYDLFDFEVFGLAHKFMNPEQFERDVAALRELWQKSLRPPSYSRQVPADGFARYATSTWEAIKKQEQLNIPNQKEMLAIYRCQEIKASVLSSLGPAVAATNAQVQRGQMDESAFSQWLRDVASKGLAEYLEHASRYQSEVCRRVKAELLEGIVSAVQPVVDCLLSRVRDSIAKAFLDKLTSSFTAATGDATRTLAGRPVLDAWGNYNDASAELLRDAQQRFLAAARACSADLTDGSHLSFATDLVLDGMTRMLTKDIASVREKQQAQLVALLQKTCDDALVGVADSLASRDFTPQQFWGTCRAKAAAAGAECVTLYSRANEGLSVSRREEERNDGKGDDGDTMADFEIQCRVIALTQLRKQIESIVANLHVLILDRFQTFFSYDDEDQPRQWESLSSEQLHKIFVHAKEQALVLLPTFACMRLHPLSVTTSTLFPPAASEAPKGASSPASSAVFFAGSPLSEAEKEELSVLPRHFFSELLDDLHTQAIHQKALRQMQQLCRDAQLLQQGRTRVSWRSVPLWAWLIILALGWNELTAILSFLTSSWIFLPFLVLALAAAAGAVLTGNAQVALASLQHFLLLAKTVAVPLAKQVLIAALSAVDGTSASPRQGREVCVGGRSPPKGSEDLRRPADVPPRSGAEGGNGAVFLQTHQVSPQQDEAAQ